MRHRDRQGNDSEINITPLLDIVFIMLIFFIVTTSFAKERGIDISRPTARSNDPEPKGNVLVEIREDGEVWINDRRVEIESVRANVEKARAQSPDSTVVVVAHRTSQTGTLVRVLDQVKLAGVSAISVAAPDRG